jgi:hypothetical protein
VQITPVSFGSPLTEYERQAEELFEAWRAGDPPAIEIFHHKHPRFLDDRIPWLPKRMSDEDIQRAALEPADARLALARWYCFLDWRFLVKWVKAVNEYGSPISRFESAVEAVVEGRRDALAALLCDDPELVRARSTRVTPFDPPQHRATLLHYVAANGIEAYREKTPPNAVEIATMLLQAGAEADALADMYGGQSTTMSMLVSSGPPAAAGVQVPLVETLIDFGAAVDGVGTGPWTSPLMTALAFGFLDVAEALVRRGARVETVAAAAGLGRVDAAAALLAGATAEDRHRAFALASQHGRAEIVRFLLDAGEDPNRYNPEGNHGHSTPLHQAVWSNHLPIVQLLVARGARLDMRDTIFEATPLGWAEYGQRSQIAEYLRTIGAPR